MGGRVRALDGARAVALVLVVLFHGGVGVPGGAIGVDVFLVLSGYLITTGLLARGRDLVGFWRRRARRLLPALLALLAVVALVDGRWAHSVDPAALRVDALASLGYVANWRFVLEGGGYFASFGSPSPLRHLWSLGVEEQFYVVWPLLLAGLVRWCRRARYLLVAVAALALCSAGLMWWLAADVDRVHFGTDTRAQGFLAGALAAVVLRHRPAAGWGVAARRVAGGAGVVGLAGLWWIGLRTHGTDPWLYRGGHLVVAAASVGLLVGALVPGGRLARVLAFRPLAALGVVSYGFYLWHWPVDVWLTPDRVGVDGWALLGVRSAGALAATLASWFLVERPFLRPAAHRTRRRARPIGWAAIGGAVAAAVVGATAGAPAPAVAEFATPTIPAGFVPPTEVEAVAMTAPPVPVTVAAAAVPATEVAAVPVTAPPPSPLDLPRPPHAQDGVLSVTVVGDSTGWALGWDVRAPRGVRVRDAGVIGCGVDPAAPLVEGQPVNLVGQPVPCAQAPDLWEWQVARNRPDVVLFTVGAWEVYDRLLPDGTVLQVGTDEWRAWVTGSVEAVAARLVQAAPDALVVLPEVPCFEERNLALGGPSSPRNDPVRVALVNEVLSAVVAEHPTHLASMTLTSWLCGGGPPGMRPDGVHLDPEGATLTWRDALAPALLSLTVP